MQNILPVITLYQPWANWIVEGWKTIETRTHNRLKSLNGKTILIHAGLSFDKNAGIRHNNHCPYMSLISNQTKHDLFYGYILGQAEVYNTRKLTKSDSLQACIECETERYGLFLKNIIKFKEPLPAKGSMGIWYYDLTNETKIIKSA